MRKEREMGNTRRDKNGNSCGEVVREKKCKTCEESEDRADDKNREKKNRNRG